jgi:hypothetical protein
MDGTNRWRRSISLADSAPTRLNVGGSLPLPVHPLRAFCSSPFSRGEVHERTMRAVFSCVDPIRYFVNLYQVHECVNKNVQT